MPDYPEVPGQPFPPQPPAAGGPPPYQPVTPGFQPAFAPGAGGAGAPPPPAGMKKGGTSPLKIILIILGVIAVLVMMVVGIVGYIGYRIAHSVRVDKDGGVSINAPGGILSSNSDMKFSPDELGADIYPGAEPSKHGNMRMNLPSGSMITASYLTSDPKEKVIDFYKSKLGSQATSMEFGGTAILSLKKGDHDVTSITVMPKGDKTQIQISHTTDKSK